MRQTLVLKGLGAFATLMGIYQWIAVEAESTDVIFIAVITVLIVLMDVEKEAIHKKDASLNPQESEKKKLIFS